MLHIYKLGGDPGLVKSFPRQPKCIHWRTHRRLQRQDYAAIEALELALYSKFIRTSQSIKLQQPARLE